MGFNNVNVNVSGPVQPTSIYKTKILKGNHSFASQVTEPNMKYVIKYDFDLGGSEVTIPENCVLEFDGGSLSNGKIISNNTVLSGDTNGTNILYGLFKNNAGEFVTYNQRKFSPNIQIDYAANVDEFAIPTKGTQGIVVYNDYIILGMNSDHTTNSGFAVFDLNQNYLGYAPITLNIGGMALYNGHVWIVDGTSSAKVVAIDDIISHISDNSEVTEIESVILTNRPHLSIGFDIANGEFATICGSDNTFFVALFDINRNMIKETPISFPSNYYKYDFQDLELKNGVASIFGHVTSYYRKSEVFYFDIYNEVYTQEYFLDTVMDDFEIEGVCDYNGKKYITGNSWTKGSCFYLGRFDDYDKVNKSYIYSETTASADIYVDNTYTGESLGLASKPFKNITTAIVMNTNAQKNILLKATNKKYKIYHDVYGILSFKGVEGKPKCIVRLRALQSGVINLDNLDIEQRDYHTSIVNMVNAGFLYINDCIITGDQASTVPLINLQRSIATCTNMAMSGVNNAFNVLGSELTIFGNNSYDGFAHVFYLGQGATLNGVFLYKDTYTNVTKTLNVSTTAETASVQVNRFTINTDNDFNALLAFLKKSTLSGIRIFGTNNGMTALGRGEYIWNGTKFYHCDGMPGCRGKGTTAQRSYTPTTELDYETGMTYYDTNLFRPMWRDNETWCDPFRRTIAPIVGTTANRPVGIGATGGVLKANRDIGREYFDTDLGKPLYVKAIANDGTVTWVDATGTPV